MITSLFKWTVIVLLFLFALIVIGPAFEVVIMLAVATFGFVIISIASVFLICIVYMFIAGLFGE